MLMLHVNFWSSGGVVIAETARPTGKASFKTVMLVHKIPDTSH